MSIYLDQLKNGKDASMIILELESKIRNLQGKILILESSEQKSKIGFSWGGYDVYERNAAKKREKK